MTAVQTTSFSAGQNGTYTDAGDGNFIGISASQPLTGFTKFDPSLGTLTEIKLTVEMDAYLELTLEVDQLVPVDATEFTAFYDPDSPFSLVQAGIIYSPTGAGVGIVTTIDGGSLPTVGVENEEAAPYIVDMGMGPEFYFTDFANEQFGGFSSGGNTETTASLLASHPDFNASDFVGSGNVVGLNVDNILNLENGFGSLLADNIPGAFIQPEVGFAAGNATLQYVYTPVPEPSASMLLILAASTALRRRRS